MSDEPIKQFHQITYHPTPVLCCLCSQHNETVSWLFSVYFDQVTHLLELNYSDKIGLDILEWLSLFAIDWVTNPTNKP